jgi:DNA oxidative demethylase
MERAATEMRIAGGFGVHSGWFDRAGQERLVAALKAAVATAPFYTPTMPKTGKPFSVRMTNLGPLGWVSDRDRGYRYQPTHPETGDPWPPIPAMVMEVWRSVADYPHPPEACLVNYYAAGAKLGLHQDADEADFAAPVVSISLGDACLFRVGGTARSDPTRSFRLSSGDVVVLGGEARMAFHGVDRIYPGTSTLLRDWFPEGGRINLTLRRVTKPG